MIWVLQTYGGRSIHSHKLYSRIDFFLVSTLLTAQVANCVIKTITITDHAPVELLLNITSDTEKRGRWRMNTALLLDPLFRKALEDDLKSFFDINLGSSQDISTVWEATKAYVRGKLIAQAAKKKSENLNKINELEKEIKNKELQLIIAFSDRLYQELCRLKYQLHEIYNKKVEYALYRLKTNF